MTQKIKVQDGNIVYAVSDPAVDVNFNIIGILNVGSVTAGTGVLSADTGQALQIKSDTVLEFHTNSVLRLAINANGSLDINGSPGTAGQVLTSAGPGSTPVWCAGGASGNPISINTQVSDYTLQISDAYDTLIRITKATLAIVTIPNDSTANLPIGAAVLISWNGLGQVTIGFEIGVTVDTPDTYDIGKQFGKITAIKTGANHWEIEGNLVPL